MKNALISGMIFGMLFFCTACTSYKKWAEPITRFSNSYAPTLIDTETEYDTVNKVHILEQEAVLFDQYPTIGYTPGSISNLISSSDISIRKAELNRLHDYVIMLNDIAVGKSLDALAEKDKTLTQNISKTTSSTSSFNFTQSELVSSFNVLDTLTYKLVQHKVKKSLPIIINDANPLIQQICQLEMKDLTLLQTQIDNDYNTILIEQSQFIDKNSKQMDPTTLRNQINKLVDIQTNKLNDDQTLQKNIKGLQNLAIDHAKLTAQLKG